MIRQAIKSLLITAGITLLMIVGVILPLHAAPPPQAGEDVILEITTTHRTVETGQKFTITASVRNDRTISMTNVGLTITSQLPASPFTQQWDVIEPGVTETHPISLRITEPMTGTLTFTADLAYSLGNTATLSQSQRIQVTITQPASPTPPPTATPSVTPSPSPTTKPTPTPPPPSPIPEPTPTPPPTGLVQLLGKKWLVICLLPLLLILGALLVIVLIRKRRQKQQPPSPPPPATPRGPYLESIDIGGEKGRFDLPPQGLSIGRGPGNDLVITEDFPDWRTVSSQHARIYQQDNRWILEDLESTNGIYVNGKRTGRNLLQDGWQLSIGGVRFVFHAGTEEVRQ